MGLDEGMHRGMDEDMGVHGGMDMDLDSGSGMDMDSDLVRGAGTGLGSGVVATLLATGGGGSRGSVSELAAQMV